MIRKTLIAALALTAAGSVYAQEAKIEENGRYTDKVYYSEDKYKVETNRFWSISATTTGRLTSATALAEHSTLP